MPDTFNGTPTIADQRFATVPGEGNRPPLSPHPLSPYPLPLPTEGLMDTRQIVTIPPNHIMKTAAAVV